jgi:LPS export ABC transporter protein LptC
MKLLLIVSISLLIFPNCSSDRIKPSIDKNLIVEKLPSQESWNSSVTFSDSGKIKAILYAGHLSMFYETKETLLEDNIKVDFYDADQIQTTTLTSKNGRVDETTNNLYAMDSVVVFSDSVTIRTEEMMWRNKDRKIISDKYVTLVSPKEKIEGYGFESDQGLKNYIIYNITFITRTDTL